MAEYFEQDICARERFETVSVGSYSPKQQEKGCYKVPKTDAKGKPGFVTVYGSGPTGSYIRHAISGEYTKYIVGSKSEELFYKVCIATGMYKDGPLTLFYGSQEELGEPRFPYDPSF
jgi:hypothetical protein